MTLSVLIPTYNFNARALVLSLVKQANIESIDAEVVVGDDASTQETAWMNEVASQPGVRIIHADHNLGRAYICNLMAREAQGKWLLFVDADAVVPKEFTFTKSLKAGFEAPVVCGGLYHPDVNPNPEATLRYRYERNADRHRSALVRSQHPHRQLSTFNLLVRRDIFLNILFDERCTEYGYEDALFGVQLGNKGIPIAHIDNPLVHMGLDTNAEFLQKTETAMRTLQRISHIMPRDAGVVGAARCLSRWHLTWAMRLFYKVFRKPIQANLLSHHPSLFLFKLYKLGYFLSL